MSRASLIAASAQQAAAAAENDDAIVESSTHDHSGDQATISEFGGGGGPFDTVVYVDGSSGNDANNGSSGSPVATIGKGIELADANNVNGDTALVEVAAGTYREFVVIDDTEAVTTADYELKGVGNVVISGAEVYTGWTDNGDGTWTHSWSFNWGYWAINPQWSNFDQQLIDYPIIRRRELVYVDGVRLDPVNTSGELVADTYYVDESANEITIHTDPTGKTVEVSEREKCLLVNWRDNVTVRNITCQYAANDLQVSTVAGANGSGLSFIDCDFSDNNYRGLGFNNVSNVTVTRLTANGNGFGGTAVSGSNNITFTDCTTNENNWRGGINQDQYSASFADIDAAGNKVLGSDLIEFDGTTATNGKCVAIWYDYTNTNGTIKNCDLSDNTYYGIFLEASAGPFTVTDNKMCRNDKGIRIANTADGTMTGCVLSDNDYAQIWVTGPFERNSVTTRNWTISDNRIACGSGTHNMAYATRDPATVFQEFATTLTADNNDWTHPSGNPEVLEEIGQPRLSFSEWQTNYGVDQNSTNTTASPQCVR